MATLYLVQSGMQSYLAPGKMEERMKHMEGEHNTVFMQPLHHKCFTIFKVFILRTSLRVTEVLLFECFPQMLLVDNLGPDVPGTSTGEVRVLWRRVGYSSLYRRAWRETAQVKRSELYSQL